MFHRTGLNNTRLSATVESGYGNVRSKRMLPCKCPYCHELFVPSRYHPDQVICSRPACQRHRRTEYHRKKLESDPGYRIQCRDSQGKWRQRNPDYMPSYRRKQQSVPGLKPPTEPLNELLRLVKNNVAIDLKQRTAAVWLICSDQDVKNTLASAKMIVIEAVMHTVRTS